MISNLEDTTKLSFAHIDHASVIVNLETIFEKGTQNCNVAISYKDIKKKWHYGSLTLHAMTVTTGIALRDQACLPKSIQEKFGLYEDLNDITMSKLIRGDGGALTRVAEVWLSGKGTPKNKDYKRVLKSRNVRAMAEFTARFWPLLVKYDSFDIELDEHEHACKMIGDIIEANNHVLKNSLEISTIHTSAYRKEMEKADNEVHQEYGKLHQLLEDPKVQSQAKFNALSAYLGIDLSANSMVRSAVVGGLHEGSEPKNSHLMSKTFINNGFTFQEKKPTTSPLSRTEKFKQKFFKAAEPSILHDHAFEESFSQDTSSLDTSNPFSDPLDLNRKEYQPVSFSDQEMESVSPRPFRLVENEDSFWRTNVDPLAAPENNYGTDDELA